MNNIPVYALPLIVLGNLLMGFIIGKLHERYEWNKLIQKGVIPAPVKKSPFSS